MEFMDWITNNGFIQLKLSPEIVGMLWLIWQQHKRVKAIEDIPLIKEHL